jgi:hypothetical protein
MVTALEYGTIVPNEFEGISSCICPADNLVLSECGGIYGVKLESSVLTSHLISGEVKRSDCDDSISDT